MMNSTDVRKLEVAAYEIPTELEESDGTLRWDRTCVIVVHVHAAGKIGLGYTYTHSAAARLIDDGLRALCAWRGHPVDRPTLVADGKPLAELGAPRLGRFGHRGRRYCAWDLKARVLGVSLVDLLGLVRDKVPIYGSGGFTSYSVDQLCQQLNGWIEQGIRRVKMKVGRHPATDQNRVKAARASIGPDAELFVDANGAYDRKQALTMAQSFAEFGVTWFEEPVSSDDFDGLHLIRDRGPAGMAITAGEYGYRTIDFRRMLDAGAVDVLMADATRCGGFTGFLSVGSLCMAHGLPLSAHTAPNVHSHICCVCPPVCHLEYFHDHARIEQLLFDGTLAPPMANYPRTAIVQAWGSPSTNKKRKNSWFGKARHNIGNQSIMAITAPSTIPRRRFHDIDTQRLAAELTYNVRGEVRFDEGSRALYSRDASNYRQVPIGVVLPKEADDVIATLDSCRRYGAPILARGGGTSLAGQCCNVAIVLDFSKYLHRVLEIDPQHRLARVQPGTNLDDLRNQAGQHGLTFGPDPATHSHCTLGGMIGNNSCGIHSVMAGRTADNVHELEVITYDGTRMSVGRTLENELEEIMSVDGRRSEIFRQLVELRDQYAELIRSRFPSIPRRVSGYNLDELLPENDFHVARSLVGTECTCAIVLEATLHLVPNPAHRVVMVLGYPDIYSAGDHVPEVMQLEPIGLEAIDDQLIRFMKRKGLHADDAALLPEGHGWLLVEIGGETKEAARHQAEQLKSALARFEQGPTIAIFHDPSDQKRIWEIRESALARRHLSPVSEMRGPAGKMRRFPQKALVNTFASFASCCRITAWIARCMVISAKDAFTPGLILIWRRLKALPAIGDLLKRHLIWWLATKGRFRGNMGTANRAPNCCRKCLVTT